MAESFLHTRPEDGQLRLDVLLVKIIVVTFILMYQLVA